MAELHKPVMLNETVDALNVRAGGVYVDGTLGRAGHTLEILRRGGKVLGIDRDEQALEESAQRVSEAGFRVADGKGLATKEEWDLKVVHGRHGDLKETVLREGLGDIDGILLDLGVSSPQLDEAARGFSFRKEGPLDMRMDRSGGVTAKDLVASLDETELAKLLREYGEEPAARRIAKAIVSERGKRAISTTVDLAAVIERTVGRTGPHHPATRAFQALRMAVNGEASDLRSALEGGLDVLRAGGRFAIITFESITDRMVKRFFAAHAGRMVSLQQGGERWEGETPRVRLVWRRAVTASEEEVSRNPRARSAKLRAAELQSGGAV